MAEHFFLPDILPPNIFSAAALSDQQWVTIIFFKYIFQATPGDVVAFHKHIIIGIEDPELFQQAEKITQIVESDVANVFTQAEIGQKMSACRV